MKISGKMSTFGGPRDKGVGPNEGLAFFESKDLSDPKIASLFLLEQPAGTTGLARRLDPSGCYIACRWDYEKLSKATLRHAVFKVTAANGKIGLARAADWGPHEDTGRAVDMSDGLAAYLGLQTNDVVTVEGPVDGGEMVRGEMVTGLARSEVAAPAAPAAQSPELEFAVGEDHWLTGRVKKMPLRAGGPMAIRRFLLMHFTNGAGAESSVESMGNQGLSAHFVINRDGKLIQCVPTNVCAAHAGASDWRDPKTGELHHNVNSCAIGIEFASAGNDPSVLGWARRNVPGFATISAAHRNGGPVQPWEIFYAPQIATGLALAKVLCERYKLDDITGHDCVAPSRKNDPGPAFPMQRFREHCGFSGLPVVFHS